MDSHLIRQEFNGLKVLEAQLRMFQGPVASPDLLHEYDQVVENGAERTFSQWERQTAHRQHLEQLTITIRSIEAAVGQVFAFLLSGFILILAYRLAQQGHDGVAGVMVGGTIVGLAGVFVYGRSRQEAERREKREVTPEKRSDI